MCNICNKEQLCWPTFEGKLYGDVKNFKLTDTFYKHILWRLTVQQEQEDIETTEPLMVIIMIFLKKVLTIFDKTHTQKALTIFDKIQKKALTIFDKIQKKKNKPEYI